MKLTKLIIFIILALFLLSCRPQSGDCDVSPGDYTVQDGLVFLDKEGTLSCELCDPRGLHNKIIFLESKFCGACKVAKPRIKTAAQETGVEVLFLDLAERTDLQKATEQFQVMVKFTPTMLVDCDVYIGSKSLEEYQKIFSDSLKK